MPKFEDDLYKDFNFEKKYFVFLEKSLTNFEGYIYLKPEYTLSTASSNKDCFTLTYHFTKKEKSRNPTFVMDACNGDNFDTKTEIINHFKKNHAIKFAVQVDTQGKFF